MPKRSPPLAGDTAAFVDFVADMSAQLASQAEEHGLQTLAHLFRMAKLEAENLAAEARQAERH